MSYEECGECGHSTEYLIESEDNAWLDKNGKEFYLDCSECIVEGNHCEEHGSCTVDPDVCLCGD